MTTAPRVHADKARLIPAAVHVDGTARIQTVDRAANPRYYALIEEFGRLTGVPVILNTSFNRREPIVASPADAVACYRQTGMDALAIGDFLVTARP
jgi:carbamoyltransferase